MFHLLDPAKKLLIENSVRAIKRLEVCTTCVDSKSHQILGKQVITCSWCGCAMAVKTQIPTASCAHPTNPLW